MRRYFFAGADNVNGFARGELIHPSGGDADALFSNTDTYTGVHLNED